MIGEAFLAREHKVVLSADVEEARAVGRERYLNLTNALNNLKRLGFSDDDVAKPGSDRLVDAVVAHCRMDAVAARLKQHLDAGADHVPVQVLTSPEKPRARTRRTGRATRPAVTCDDLSGADSERTAKATAVPVN
jgi:probable F420-dependent oxidoreductase